MSHSIGSIHLILRLKHIILSTRFVVKLEWGISNVFLTKPVGGQWKLWGLRAEGGWTPSTNLALIIICILRHLTILWRAEHTPYRYGSHHHHLLFWKCRFLPRQARVGRLPRGRQLNLWRHFERFNLNNKSITGVNYNSPCKKNQTWPCLAAFSTSSSLLTIIKNAKLQKL